MPRNSPDSGAARREAVLGVLRWVRIPALEAERCCFLISATEVPLSCYRSFCEATGGSIHPAGRARPVTIEQESHPAMNLTWDEALAFCRWLGGRLPSEAEWLRAAEPRGLGPYPWGSDPPGPSLANLADRALAQEAPELGGVCAPWNDGFPWTAPCGSFPEDVSRWGLHDLAGNVREWTSSTDEAGNVVVMGASFLDGPHDVIGARASIQGSKRFRNVGFRVVREACGRDGCSSAR
ncbi:MAG: SUMF1/EgtB/PvdO family nonheme iron enzyme [Planctomycetota bacterium]|nr:SUMF1/EgtB/PvdO family nonheme iron enzyme [Planctomycetota bacterium]